MPMNFLTRLKDRLQAAPEAAAPRGPACAPAGTRIFAVGDVHGRADLMDRMAALVARDLAEFELEAGTNKSSDGGPMPADYDQDGFTEADAATGHAIVRSGEGALTIFLGDYIDRGPDSRRAIEMLSAREWPTPILALIGNHEFMCLQFLLDASALAAWRRVGGLATLASYGVDVAGLMGAELDARAAEEARAAFDAAIPDAHRAFLLQGLHRSASARDYFFCHAGVRPGIPLNRQDPLDLMMVRDVFLRSDADFGKIVVHGHTPLEQPVFRPNRIGIDTGAYATGVLTALVLEGDGCRLLQTR